MNESENGHGASPALELTVRLAVADRQWLALAVAALPIRLAAAHAGLRCAALRRADLHFCKKVKWLVQVRHKKHRTAFAECTWGNERDHSN